MAWIWIASAVLTFIIVGPLSRLVLAAVFGSAIGAKALARQPDAIHLEPAPPEAWRDAANAQRAAAALHALGFEETGSYTVPELPGLTLKLLCHTGAAMYAAVYEHPVSGAWIDVYMRYDDGTSATFTTHASTGLDERPGHPVVHLASADPRSLFEQAQSKRPAGTLEPARPAGAVATFERGYAESIAWRKARGISRGEVVAVARKRAA